jgi:hypothetical protein
MALRLVKGLRKGTVLNLSTRGRPAASDEIVEPPTEFYVVKDYDRNPYYMALVNATKPGYKKAYDPFKKYSERRESAWEPRYKHHQIDMSLGWLQLFTFIFLPIFFIVSTAWEGRYVRFRTDPLSLSFSKPNEF